MTTEINKLTPEQINDAFLNWASYTALSASGGALAIVDGWKAGVDWLESHYKGPIAALTWTERHNERLLKDSETLHKKQLDHLMRGIDALRAYVSYLEESNAQLKAQLDLDEEYL
jgi:hypothetical protein